MVTNDSRQVGAAERSPDPRSDEQFQNDDPLSGERLLVTKQAEEVLDETTDAVEVVSHFDLAAYAQDDPFPDWHNSKPFEPMPRALNEDSKVAAEFGFDPDDVPNQMYALACASQPLRRVSVDD